MNSNTIIIIGSIIVAFIFVTWLVRYIIGLKKTRDFYQKKISEMDSGNTSKDNIMPPDTGAGQAEKQTEDD